MVAPIARAFSTVSTVFASILVLSITGLTAWCSVPPSLVKWFWYSIRTSPVFFGSIVASLGRRPSPLLPLQEPGRRSVMSHRIYRDIRPTDKACPPESSCKGHAADAESARLAAPHGCLLARGGEITCPCDTRYCSDNQRRLSYAVPEATGSAPRRESENDVIGIGLSGRRAHDRQSVHSAGAAVRIRPRRPAVPENGLPMLAGMAVTFAAVATLAAVAGGWVVEANQYGRIVALALMAAFGLTLIFPALADRVMQPLVRLGASFQLRPSRGGRTSGDDRAVASARRRDRIFVGAVRGPGARPDPDRRRAQGRQRRHNAPAARLRRRCRHVAGARSCSSAGGCSRR